MNLKVQQRDGARRASVLEAGRPCTHMIRRLTDPGRFG
jgi:hypothetical protein